MALCKFYCPPVTRKSAVKGARRDDESEICCTDAVTCGFYLFLLLDTWHLPMLDVTMVCFRIPMLYFNVKSDLEGGNTLQMQKRGRAGTLNSLK